MNKADLTASIASILDADDVRAQRASLAADGEMCRCHGVQVMNPTASGTGIASSPANKFTMN